LPIQYVSIAYGYLPHAVQRAIAAIVARVSAALPGRRWLPPPKPGGCPKVPIIGAHLPAAIRGGAVRVRGGIAALTADGVRWLDGDADPFDEIILATGFRAAVGLLGDQIHLDACGFGRRRRRVVSDDQPGLYFVGHNPDIRGGLFSIGRDARRTARLVAATRS
jgi:putative flavoprotein involved in K+ transport